MAEEKPTLPCLPKQIKDDLQKFRKAQGRRIIHNRLHTYINQLCDTTPTLGAVPLATDSILGEEKSNSLNEICGGQNNSSESGNFHKEAIFSPSSSFISPSLPSEMRREQVNLPRVCPISSEATPIGQKLERLSINENENSPMKAFSHEQNISNQNFVQERDEYSSSNMTNNAISNNQNSSTIGYDIF